MDYDAYKYCVTQNQTCPSTIESTHSNIFNDLTAMYYRNYQTLDEAGRANLIVKIENLTSAYRDGNNATFFSFVQTYHTQYIPWKLFENGKE